MGHNLRLMKLLLLNVRDGGHENEVKTFPEPLVLNQSAYLIDGGYVDGNYLDNNHGITNVAMTRLLPPGHAYLAQLERKKTTRTGTPKRDRRFESLLVIVV
jgi:hypothetical protein